MCSCSARQARRPCRGGGGGALSNSPPAVHWAAWGGRGRPSAATDGPLSPQLGLTGPRVPLGAGDASEKIGAVESVLAAAPNSIKTTCTHE